MEGAANGPSLPHWPQARAQGSSQDWQYCHPSSASWCDDLFRRCGNLAVTAESASATRRTIATTDTRWENTHKSPRHFNFYIVSRSYVVRLPRSFRTVPWSSLMPSGIRDAWDRGPGWGRRRPWSPAQGAGGWSVTWLWSWWHHGGSHWHEPDHQASADYISSIQQS